MIPLIFWLSFGLLVYIYFGYPLMTRVVAGLVNRPVRKDEMYQPRVSILIAAYNEAKDIEATLKNKLALDYPADKLEVLVISDESDDGTDDIIECMAASARFPIRLFRQVPRQGKTAGLNTLVPQTTGDIILFSDANSQWDSQAVSQLCSNFADPDVGYVTGKMVYVNDDGSLVGDGCSAYMKYENWLREQETRLGSVVGVDGGIDAMRKTLYQPLNADQLPDFVQPLKVVEQGYRVVYEPRALLKEEALNDSDSEFSMRVRVSLRALWALKDMRHLMSPFRDPVFAWQLISHKLLRYTAFVPLITLAISTLLLAPARGIYTLAFLGLVVFGALAWTGHKREGEGQPLSVIYSIPYYFMLLNIASYKATAAFLKGEKKVIWNPRKG
ncbi:glycosyltransferase family 2 protein [Marinobacter panjinensis]|uniref:Glycosyltransferase family 2 protein n=1 Tax=Marinobacter panjinensis TaxID=2576384 RepID=A0A4V6CTY3_9GAMM|nr:glycosyltransferase family 2 protein [Marinobacter panjinensis]MCR8915808.1 glycosyltransferase family 2 protein [Marinobacter panjinensis]TKV67215.1 glycosyltransferase family 2 protein [Marinobacter panjinensis]